MWLCVAICKGHQYKCSVVVMLCHCVSAWLLTAGGVSLIWAVHTLWLPITAPPSGHALSVRTGKVCGRTRLLCCWHKGKDSEYLNMCQKVSFIMLDNQNVGKFARYAVNNVSELKNWNPGCAFHRSRALKKPHHLASKLISFLGRRGGTLIAKNWIESLCLWCK